MDTRRRFGVVVCVLVIGGGHVGAGGAEPDTTKEMFGRLRLVDEVIPGKEEARHRFIESARGISEVREILGRPTRVMPAVGDSPRFVSYRLGQGKNLQARRAYVLQVDYPEDVSRTMFVHVRGAETSRGLSTGQANGDVLVGKYTDSNIESLRYPLSGKHESFQMLFFLQDQYPDLRMPRDAEHPRNVTPADGIPVIVSQFRPASDPLSHGAAFSRIALYEVTDQAALALEINYPPAGVPRRHLFWREEMSDSVVGRNGRGWNDELDWYRAKAELMRFLGMNTFVMDMLEFGHNQGWDSAPGGGNDWVNQSHSPKRQENVLRMLAANRYDFIVLPYYEYAGSVGAKSPGTRRLARPLSDTRTYTHIAWSEKAYADITEPVILDDAKKVLDLTIHRWRGIMPIAGAWFRTRPSHMPVSFSDRALAKFATEKHRGWRVTRAQLRDRGELYREYIAWWNEERKEFLEALRDHVRSGGAKDAVIFFTAESSEPGPTLAGGGKKVVTDDRPTWERLLKDRAIPVKVVAFEEVVTGGQHLKAALSSPATWGHWEWDHSVPPADPANYKKTDGIVLTYPFNRIYTVSSPAAFDAFRTPSGLGIVRHYCLNEHEVHDKDLGYFVMDVDRDGRFMMLAEVLAVANGDPWHIGYLAGHQFNRGFPAFARRFNQAFLSLPALPSVVLPKASSDSRVVVRMIKTPKSGTYLAICHGGFEPLPSVTIQLPVSGKVTDAAVNKPLVAVNGTLKLSMDAAELRAVRIE
jgi:hypothetical protein